MSVKQDALRWQYVRDVVWRGVKRADLPPEIEDAFYLNDCDTKYPTAKDLDDALDTIISRRQL